MISCNVLYLKLFIYQNSIFIYIMENNDLIWYRGKYDPEISFSGSLWVTLHSQILSYSDINDYIIRVNKINKIMEFRNSFGFVYTHSNLNTLSNYLNYSLKKMNIKNFKIQINENNDIIMAMNYIRNRRFLMIGIPYFHIKKYIKYNTVNPPEDLIEYFVAFNMGDDIILVPSIYTDEVKMHILEFYNKNSEKLIKINYEDFTELYKNIDDEHKKIIYINVLNKNGMEIKSLREF